MLFRSPNNVVSFSGDFSSDSYSDQIIGLDGTGHFVTSGPGTQPVVALWYAGAGVAFEVDGTDPGATLQDKINNALLDPLFQPPNAPFDINAVYTLTGFSSTGTGTVLVTPSGPLAAVPEPASALLLAAGVGAAGGLARWRRRPGRRRAAPSTQSDLVV